jgi:hypothetical protein
MGLFGFGRKKYVKNVDRDNEFLKDYSVKVNGLKVYVEDNAKITKELVKLQEDFEYAVASPEGRAKGVEKKIEHEFKKLVEVLQQPSWAEDEVSILIKNLRRFIVEISSMQ